MAFERACATSEVPKDEALGVVVGDLEVAIARDGEEIFAIRNECSHAAVALSEGEVAGGTVDCALALGFEQMVPRALANVFTDRPAALERFDDARAEIQGVNPDAPMAAQLFGGAGQAYVDEFGIDPAVFAEISVKAEVAKAMTYNALRLFHNGIDAIKEVTQAKLFSQRALVEVADEVIQIHGGYGYMREYGVERAYRDARLGPIGGGTDEIMKEILSKQLGL